MSNDIVTAGTYGYRANRDKGVWEQIDLKTKQIVGSIPLVDKPQTALTKQEKKAKAQSPYTPYVPVAAKFEKEELTWGRQCLHKGEEAIWQYQGRAFFAAGFGGISPAKYDLVIDCADMTHMRSRQIVDSSVAKYDALNKYSPAGNTPIIKLAWADGKGFVQPVQFWTDLWGMLPKGTKDKPARILVCCFGSHGRTGTALASLMLASGDNRLWSPAMAILWIRTYHCEQAVESMKQVEYLNALAGQLDLDQDGMETNIIQDSPAALKEWQDEAAAVPAKEEK